MGRLFSSVISKPSLKYTWNQMRMSPLVLGQAPAGTTDALLILTFGLRARLSICLQPMCLHLAATGINQSGNNTLKTYQTDTGSVSAAPLLTPVPIPARTTHFQKKSLPRTVSMPYGAESHVLEADALVAIRPWNALIHIFSLWPNTTLRKRGVFVEEASHRPFWNMTAE